MLTFCPTEGQPRHCAFKLEQRADGGMGGGRSGGLTPCGVGKYSVRT